MGTRGKIMKSIIQDTKECFITGQTTGLHKHHIFGGANRDLSEKYGLTIWLISQLHNMGGDKCVHQNKELMQLVRRTGQLAFERVHGTREDFIKIFGRNYLEVDDDSTIL